MNAGRTKPAQQVFAEYFRCPEHLTMLETSPGLSAETGFFAFDGVHCYGRPAGIDPCPDVGEQLPDLLNSVRYRDRSAVLPFDLAEVVTNLREERYCHNGYPLLSRITSGAFAQEAYYKVRPFMSVGVRRHLQQLRLKGWDRIPFPRGPVDSTVDELMMLAARALLEATGLERLPFIWFWPEGAPSCTMLTHDVEGQQGLEFCDQLMTLDEGFGMKTAFQLIPESPHDAWAYADEIRGRGCEANLHDLNHDGRLFRNRRQFLERARRINEYVRRYGSNGFRSGAMYRQQQWFDAFEFSYDMSVPNAAHLEPQRGGCCTVMPYFVGNILELPLTTTQDYSLFFILETYSAALWRDEVDAICERNGLVSIVTHPDYLTGPAERSVYTELLEYVAQLRDTRQTWAALPGDVNKWWRERQNMTLVPEGESWRIEGVGNERARVAYAQLDGNRVALSVDPR